jgi:hypothetical protein
MLYVSIMTGLVISASEISGYLTEFWRQLLKLGSKGSGFF